MHSFDKIYLANQLSQLEHKAQICFATACATRLLSVYATVRATRQDRLNVITRAMDRAWGYAQGCDNSSEDIHGLLDEVMAVIHTEYESKSELGSFATESATAAAYALRSILSPGFEEPIWAAQCMYEVVGGYVRNRIAVRVHGAEIAQIINSSELMAKEFARQSRDLEQLRNFTSEIAVMMRAQAEAEQCLPEDFISHIS